MTNSPLKNDRVVTGKMLMMTDGHGGLNMVRDTPIGREQMEGFFKAKMAGERYRGSTARFANLCADAAKVLPVAMKRQGADQLFEAEIVIRRVGPNLTPLAEFTLGVIHKSRLAQIVQDMAYEVSINHYNEPKRHSDPEAREAAFKATHDDPVWTLSLNIAINGATKTFRADGLTLDDSYRNIAEQVLLKHPELAEKWLVDNNIPIPESMQAAPMEEETKDETANAETGAAEVETNSKPEQEIF